MINTFDTQTIQSKISDFISDPDQWDISLSGTGAVRMLERKFMELVGHSYTLSIANATSGLWAVFMALGIHNSDVITTPYTWGGSLSGLMLAGNRPVFVDIDRDTLTLDPEKVARSITPKTKAILAVDIYGYPCEANLLRKVADEHGLFLIQDCAQSFGAYLQGHHTGWYADASIFSLTVGKALFAGEGGMIVTKNQELYDQLVWQTQHPHRQMRDIPEMPVNELAMNLRMHPLAAIWAEACFDKALAYVSVQQDKCFSILEFLDKENLIQSKVPDKNKVKPSFYALTIEPRCKSHGTETILKENGWTCRVCVPSITKPIYNHEAYLRLSRSKRPKQKRCPVAEGQCKNRVRIVFPIT
jgi:dTDP-4-amino-4,6-dideoxygalactose transaminase